MKKIINSFLHLVMICKMTRKERRRRKELIEIGNMLKNLRDY
jgi:hypothetical protein